ncbi:iron-containing alcohol dehydrogenase, partial [bacterium]
TSGTGSEATWAVVLTDTVERRKLGLGNREVMPDVAIVDPALVGGMPPRLCADTGLDALTHAIEGFTSIYASDYTDGLCLHALRLIFTHLPASVAGDPVAREHMHNAATLAGLGFGNSMAALAHGMGHSLGGVLHVPHGRAVSLFLPYTIEFCVRGGGTRYAELARVLGLPFADETGAGLALAAAVRSLERSVGQVLTLRDAGISRETLEAELPLLVDNALNDTQTIMASRVASDDELRALFRAAWDGQPVDF